MVTDEHFRRAAAPVVAATGENGIKEADDAKTSSAKAEPIPAKQVIAKGGRGSQDANAESAETPDLQGFAHSCEDLHLQSMGLGRFELPTSPLSAVRSSQLSYKPVFFNPALGSDVRTIRWLVPCAG